MSILRNFTSGLRALFHKEEVEQEMDEELRGFLDAAVKEKMRSGMSHDEAWRAARGEMGSLDAVKEEIRRSGWESTLKSLWQDLCYGLRKELQLAQRTELLVKEAVMSKARVWLSVTVIAGLLILAGAVGVWVFPLLASAETNLTPLVTSGPAQRWAVPPVYPPALRAAGIEGNVTLRVTIEKDGSVSEVENWAGNPQLAQAAVEAVRRWKYMPRKKAVTRNVSLAFTNVKEPHYDYFDKDYLGPVPIYTPEAGYLEKAEASDMDTSVVVLAMIAADGRVTDVKAAPGIDQGLTDHIVKVVRTWRYRPAMKSGKPVPAFMPIGFTTTSSSVIVPIP
jgi:TonB family protein